MSSTVIFILGEVFVVLLGISSFQFYLRWKRKKLKSAEIEKLLNNINSQQTERLSLLINHLKENYDLQNDPAGESGGLVIEAEKQFLQQFLKQQIEQTPLTDFYSNLCELLDQYLYLLTPKNTEHNISNDEAPLLIAESIDSVEDDFGVGDTSPVAEETVTESELESALDDEFAESETASEPDWGDAFAESGDEVDEATKDSYEADLKKE